MDSEHLSNQFEFKRTPGPKQYEKTLFLPWLLRRPTAAACRAVRRLPRRPPPAAPSAACRAVRRGAAARTTGFGQASRPAPESLGLVDRTNLPTHADLRSYPRFVACPSVSRRASSVYPAGAPLSSTRRCYIELHRTKTLNFHVPHEAATQAPDCSQLGFRVPLPAPLLGNALLFQQKTTRQLRLAGKRGLRGQRGTGGGASGVLRWRAFDGSGHIRIPRGSNGESGLRHIISSHHTGLHRRYWPHRLRHHASTVCSACLHLPYRRHSCVGPVDWIPPSSESGAIDCALYGAEGREALRPPFLLHGNPISVSERCREMVTEVGCKTPSTKIERYGELPSRKRPSRPSGEVGEGQPEGGKRRREKKLAAGMSAAGQDRIRASHILIKHEGSRRKSSWKDPDGHVISSTSREKAIELIMELRGEIATGRALFEDLAARHSDCSSAKRGGDLGRFGKGQMQKPFEQAAFSLKVGELSDIVETDSGVHLILRTG
ncbi:hypothetical protein HPP92_001873 [Vanilla planifolia]|uniref:Peptidyl-prolyl cis-trans isomerase Pin1 n=1 Tax=Vanilla planifolia TaxID=51239 RepID=A0A835S0P6_VANPL|nr:hypothetical protein HPP92_001873 [Vanilla planifolia]